MRKYNKSNYIILIFIIIIIIFLILLFYLNNNTKIKQFKKNKTEFFNMFNIYTNKKKNKNYLNKEPLFILWTGGYDSTFRICQALIDEKEIVQPIYISDIIDNKPEKINERRHSLKNEYDAMNKIRLEINKLFPFTKISFLPLIDIKKINIDYDIRFHMSVLKKQNRVRRAICQYGAISQLSINLNYNSNKIKYLEVSVEKDPHNSRMYKTIHNKVNCYNNKCYLKSNLNREDESLSIFNYLVFSTLNYTKQDMLDISKKGNYENILKLTWSCWYPKNNMPCKKCIMCKDRLI